MIDEIKQLIEDDDRFHFQGRGHNLGVYTTDKTIFVDFKKAIGGKSFGRLAIFLFEHTVNGVNIKIDAWLPSYCEWYTIFEGWLESADDYTTITRLLGI